MREMKFKSRFSLPLPEADFVCALALELGVSPDDAVRFLVRYFAEFSDPSFAKLVWARAKEEGRGPWK